jgi:hypothetical protein
MVLGFEEVCCEASEFATEDVTRLDWLFDCNGIMLDMMFV